MTAAAATKVPVLGLVENMSGFVCPSCGHHEAVFLQGGGRRLAAREGFVARRVFGRSSAARGARCSE